MIILWILLVLAPLLYSLLFEPAVGDPVAYIRRHHIALDRFIVDMSAQGIGRIDASPPAHPLQFLMWPQADREQSLHDAVGRFLRRSGAYFLEIIPQQGGQLGARVYLGELPTRQRNALHAPFWAVRNDALPDRNELNCRPIVPSWALCERELW